MSAEIKIQWLEAKEREREREVEQEDVEGRNETRKGVIR